mmetsp:Transcript_22113/g.69182  ORF Transcript_22113/g.69182 Transcript_22113/m.69182 type:complete len:288 (-) Transcript_22113:128-991(-)
MRLRCSRDTHASVASASDRLIRFSISTGDRLVLPLRSLFECVAPGLILQESLDRQHLGSEDEEIHAVLKEIEQMRDFPKRADDLHEPGAAAEKAIVVHSVWRSRRRCRILGRQSGRFRLTLVFDPHLLRVVDLRKGIKDTACQLGLTRVRRAVEDHRQAPEIHRRHLLQRALVVAMRDHDGFARHHVGARNRSQEQVLHLVRRKTAALYELLHATLVLLFRLASPHFVARGVQGTWPSKASHQHVHGVIERGHPALVVRHGVGRRRRRRGRTKYPGDAETIAKQGAV